MNNYILEYWKEIESKKVIVSKKVRKQYKKLVDDLKKTDPYIFDIEKANRPIQFIEKFCKHSKGEWAGKPVKLELFQKAYISALFGFVEKKTGLRQYRESLFFVARKNGKSTMLSGIALYMLIADNEPGAEIYSTATKFEQANLIFDETHNMIKQSPYLNKHLRKRKADLYFKATMSKFKALGKNSNSLDGLNSHLVIMDELHGVTDRNLYEVMQQSQSARRQPLLIMITTAGTVRESIFDDTYNYASKVIEGTFEDERFLPIMYELDSKKEWTNKDCWIKANPGLGTIKDIEFLERNVQKAKDDPVSLNGLLIKDFNIRGTTSTAWLSFDDINNESTFDLERFRGSYCIGGADLAITGDLTACSILMMDKDTEERFVHTMYWLPADKFDERVYRDKIPYDIWKEQGLLRLCNGNTINYSDITAWFLEVVNDYGITPLWIYYDSYSARYWVDEMESHGFKMVRCIQGAKTLSLPMQQMGADLVSKKINYNNNPIMKWNLTNTGIQTDRNGNIVPVKNQSPKKKIDGMASMLDSYVGLMDHFEEFKRAL